MPTRCLAIRRCVLVGLLFLLGLGRQLPAPTVHAQTDSSGSPQRPASQGSAPAAAGMKAARELFRQHCVKCHGADGTGGVARGPFPDIPNFTEAGWQGRRSDAQLLASIPDGKGSDMPPFRRKVSAEQARGLVAYVRAFAPIKGKSRKKEQEEDTPASFQERYRRLQEQLDELKRQYRELSKDLPGGGSSK